MQTPNENSPTPKALGTTTTPAASATTPSKSKAKPGKRTPPAATLGRAIRWPEIEPASNEQDGAQVLDCISATVSNYMVIKPALADTVALWRTMTHLTPG